MAALDYPANPTNGQVYNGFYYDAAKTKWRPQPTSVTIHVIQDTAPTSPTNGMVWTDSRDGTSYQWWVDADSSQWVQVSASIVSSTPDPLPAGTIMAWGAATPPTNWLICDGSAVDRFVYSGLFATIGTTYGAGNGGSTFNLPNLKGRMPMGKDSTIASMDTLGETGGTLGLPVVGGGTATGYGLTYSDSMTTAVSSGASAIPPYVVMNYIIKATAGVVPTDTAWQTSMSASLQAPVRLNSQSITANYTIPSGYNGSSAGPITIADGVVVTIADGSAWSIV